MASARDICFIVLAVLALVSFLTVQMFSFLSPGEDEGSVDEYDTDLNPPGWAFSIWFIIYIWQFSWMIYVLTTLCRQIGNKPVYQQLHVISIPFLLIYIINMALNAGFFYVFTCADCGTIILTASVGSVWLTALICLVIYHRNMTRVPEVTAKLLRKDLISLVVLVQNGLAIYVSWCTLATMICVNSFFVFYLDIPMSTSSPIVLSILSAIVLVYFFLEMTCFKDYLKYTLSFYPALMWGLGSVTIDKFDPQSLTSIYVVVLLAVVTIFFIVKIVLRVISAKRAVPPEPYGGFNKA